MYLPYVADASPPPLGCPAAGPPDIKSDRHSFSAILLSLDLAFKGYEKWNR